MLASVTRLRVRHFRILPSFLWMTFLAHRQTVRSPGFLGGRLLVHDLRTYWTLTMWENEKMMKVFRGSGPHARVMTKLTEWCDEAAYAHWTVAHDSMPEWPAAYEHLVSEGRLSRVAHPSQDHSARHFSKPRLLPLIEKKLKPIAIFAKYAA